MNFNVFDGAVRENSQLLNTLSFPGVTASFSGVVLSIGQETSLMLPVATSS